MGEMQLWQSDGLGTDKDTLKKVLNIFKNDGVQGMESQQALKNYIEKLGSSDLEKMYEIDPETTLQILVDCFGASKAFYKYVLMADDVSVDTDELKKSGWIHPKVYVEVTAKYEERVKSLNEEKDRLQREYSVKNYEKEEAEQQIKELQNSLAHYKADLYDFYAQAGKIPNYERR